MAKRIIQTKALNIGQEIIPYFLYESAAARNIWIKVGIGGKIEVTKPWNLPIYKVEEFLKSKIAWIKRKIRKYKKLGARSYIYKFADGEQINLFGKKYQIKISSVAGKIKKFFIKINDTDALINIYASNCSIKLSKIKFENFLKSQIKEYVFEQTKNIAAQNNFQYHKITIRSQKTRWGSCSKNKNLNFNWRLVFFPKEIINYVILHELTHTKELNHSKNFWQRIVQLCPKYKSCIKQLK